MVEERKTPTSERSQASEVSLISNNIEWKNSIDYGTDSLNNFAHQTYDEFDFSDDEEGMGKKSH